MKKENIQKRLKNKIPSLYKQNYFFSDLIQRSSRSKPYSTPKAAIKSTILNSKRTCKIFLTSNRKMKNISGCFSDFRYISNPYRGAYDIKSNTNRFND